MSGQTIPPAATDVVIIGGGVIGLAIARALALRGVRDAMLIERGRLGAEASFAAGGILAPQIEADKADEFFELACQSRDLYPAFARALHEETGTDVELDTTGTLYVAFNQSEEAELRHRCEWQTKAGYALEWLSADAARRLEPCISDRVRCALRFPNDIQVENRKLLTALALACERLGVRLVTECRVDALDIESGKVRGVETSLGFVSAPIVVVAAGAWTSLIKAAAATVPIEPVRGQMLCFEARPQIARHVIYSSRGYLVPRRDGRLLAGSTTEHAGFDKSVTIQGIEAIKSMAFEIAPVLEHRALVDAWAGFRPRASDDLPVLGPSPEVEGLFYATGHYRNGILLAPITGETIATAIVEHATPSQIASFSPNRIRLEAAKV